MFDTLRQTIATAARKTAVSLLGVVFLLIGLGFLTAAAYLALAEWRDPTFACLVIGLVYCGIAFLLVAVASLRGKPTPVRQKAPPSSETPGYDPDHPMASVIAAFVQGMLAGSSRRH